MLVGKIEGKRPSRRPGHKWADNNKKHFREMGWGNIDLIHLAQDRYQWRALFDTVMNFREFLE
jgi:hypothetical protein